MGNGLSYEMVVNIGVVGVLMMVAGLFIIYYFRIIISPSLTFQEVLDYCEDGVAVIDHQNPHPNLNVFFLQSSQVHIEYARIRNGSSSVEIIQARRLNSQEKLRVDFRNNKISRWEDFVVWPDKQPINCSAAYSLRTVAEKIAQEYLRLHHSESSS